MLQDGMRVHSWWEFKMRMYCRWRIGITKYPRSRRISEYVFKSEIFVPAVYDIGSSRSTEYDRPRCGQPFQPPTNGPIEIDAIVITFVIKKCCGHRNTRMEAKKSTQPGAYAREKIQTPKMVSESRGTEYSPCVTV